MTNGYTAQVRSTGNKFLSGVAAGAVIIALSCSSIASAGEADTSAVVMAGAATTSSTRAAPIEETNRYYMRLMTQIFDGSQDFSHTQVAGFARMRKDNQSWTLMDFGDGAVVISDADGVAAGGFTNVSGTELGVLYDYDSKRIAGRSDLAMFHNEFVRPQLDKSPDLGADASWKATLPASSLGISGLTGGDAAISIARSYFTYDGKPMVLVEYHIPVASFQSASGTKITHWGRGFALSDPGFGTIYANVALHRSAASENDGSIRPYRFYRAAFASDDKGKPMLDIAKIPQVAAIYSDYFSKAALEVIPYSEQVFGIDQSPVRLATNLDIMAMSIGENGANDNGAIAAAQTGSKRGKEKASSDGRADNLARAEKAATNINTTVTVVDKTTSITGAIYALNEHVVSYQSKLQSTANAINETATQIAQANKQRERLLNTTLDTEKVFEKTAEIGALTSKYLALKSELKTIVNESTFIGRQAEKLIELSKDVPLPKLKSILDGFSNSPASKILTGVNAGLNINNTGKAVSSAVGAASTDLSSGALPLNRKYVGGSNSGLDNFESLRDLGLDVLGLAVDGASGNVVGAVSGGASLLSQSLSDVYISAKAVQDTHELNIQILNQRIELLKKQEVQSRADEKQKLAVLKANPPGLYTKDDPYEDGYDLQSPGYDPKTGDISETRKQYLIKHNRGEAIRLGLIDPNKPGGGTPPFETRPATPPPVTVKPKPVDPGPSRAELLKGLAKEIDKQDYPTAPPGANDKRPPKVKPAAVKIVITPAQKAELDRQRRKAQAQADLDAYQAKRRDDRKKEDTSVAKARGGALTTTELKVSTFGDKPVTFSGVDFKQVQFDDDEELFVRNDDGTTSLKKVGPDDFVLPTFIPPKFDPPSTSEVKFTNFADDDYPGGDSVPAFGYESLSGKVATDLGPWEAWLATQNVRELERLAREAGYPNLASALTDAANLIRQSQDTGYRKWAATAPSCGGYIGCGPSYLERWAMKASIVGLGDILNMSRDVFSTGGLSDIAISGDVLAYMLRDFGLQDGDIVDVLIQQFGRTSFSGRVNLTNAGEAFRLNLRRGVAQLTLTAVNEGTASPNTAEINIGEVTRGDGRQTYSLNTGQSATLRIETNRPRGN